MLSNIKFLHLVKYDGYGTYQEDPHVDRELGRRAFTIPQLMRFLPYVVQNSTALGVKLPFAEINFSRCFDSDIAKFGVWARRYCSEAVPAVVIELKRRRVIAFNLCQKLVEPERSEKAKSIQRIYGRMLQPFRDDDSP